MVFSTFTGTFVLNKITAMNKCLYFVLTILMGLMVHSTFAQKLEEDFHIILEDTITPVSSQYAHLEFIDSRLDTMNLGVVQKGAFNRKARVKNQVPLEKQFDSVFNRVNSFKNENGDTLVFQLRNMKFAELTQSFKETGFFYLRGTLYKKQGGNYYEISKMDTVAQFNAGDVTKKNYKNGTSVLLNFFKKGITLTPSEEFYTVEQVLNIDDLEKQQIPLYTSEVYTNGIYKDFESFKNLTPNSDSIQVKKNKKGKILSVSYKGDTGVYYEANPKFFYAFVYEGIPYICTEFGFYEVTKMNDNFYYTGRVKVTPNTAKMVVASALFGVIGAIITTENSNNECIIMIDHLSGESIIDAKLND